MSVICYPYRRLHHGAQHVYSLLPGSKGSFMQLVIKHVTRLRGVCLESIFCQPTYVPPMEVPDMSSGYGYRPSVIPGLLVGYNAKPIGADLGRDTQETSPYHA
ncbi:hypothetical protein CsSME_00025692 [Camellia sinensis var. sinensis]